MKKLILLYVFSLGFLLAACSSSAPVDEAKLARVKASIDSARSEVLTFVGTEEYITLIGDENDTLRLKQTYEMSEAAVNAEGVKLKGNGGSLFDPAEEVYYEQLSGFDMKIYLRDTQSDESLILFVGYAGPYSNYPHDWSWHCSYLDKADFREGYINCDCLPDTITMSSVLAFYKEVVFVRHEGLVRLVEKQSKRHWCRLHEIRNTADEDLP